MDAETYHRECIQEIALRAKREMQPHIDALTRIESLKPTKPVIVAVDANGHVLYPLTLLDDPDYRKAEGLPPQ